MTPEIYHGVADFVGDSLQLAMKATEVDADVIVHPECTPEVVAEADFTGSTKGIIDWVHQHKPARAMLVTECSMASNIADELPEVSFPAGGVTTDPDAISQLRHIMTNLVGVVRDGEGLRQALYRISALESTHSDDPSFLNMTSHRQPDRRQRIDARGKPGGALQVRFPRPGTRTRSAVAHDVGAGLDHPRRHLQGTRMSLTSVPDLVLEPMVRNALLEDLGSYGDVTSRTVIPSGTRYVAQLNAREDGVVSGLKIAALTFRLVDPTLAITMHVTDGQPCRRGDLLMQIDGDAASILAGERVALNFAGRMCGIATKTAAFVAEARGTHARITCTRKITPGLRVAEKLAVLHGGGFNHRISLSDAILIKDNHIAAAGGVRPVLEAVRANASHMVAVEIEVDRLDQLAEVLAIGGASVVLLDNMDNEMLTDAVAMVGGRIKTEASGNVTLDRIASIAATGVDYISSSALTHSVRTLDLGLH